MDELNTDETRTPFEGYENHADPGPPPFYGWAVATWWDEPGSGVDLMIGHKTTCRLAHPSVRIYLVRGDDRGRAALEILRGAGYIDVEADAEPFGLDEVCKVAGIPGDEQIYIVGFGEKRTYGEIGEIDEFIRDRLVATGGVIASASGPFPLRKVKAEPRGLRARRRAH